MTDEPRIEPRAVDQVKKWIAVVCLAAFIVVVFTALVAMVGAAWRR